MKFLGRVLAAFGELKTRLLHQGSQPNNTIRFRSTVGPDGIGTSWTRRDGSSRMVSTVWHPNGCYQVAVLGEPGDPTEILGWKSAPNSSKAIQIHVQVVKAILNSDPEEWVSWTSPVEDSIEFIKISVKDHGTWDLIYLNELLSAHGFPKATSRT